MTNLLKDIENRPQLKAVAGKAADSENQGDSRKPTAPMGPIATPESLNQVIGRLRKVTQPATVKEGKPVATGSTGAIDLVMKDIRNRDKISLKPVETREAKFVPGNPVPENGLTTALKVALAELNTKLGENNDDSEEEDDDWD
ncbi:hypothetical protein DdX_17959 [Ditylenchus destructor]|uniref:Uncharacterized protein n=1 Tax=Ditylenchus destructor TaxID=166010 RepID=A0AAD4ML46_9BILA|nr:hypothetical protein DdX_17959 [Ditylenchus destructor]